MSMSVSSPPRPGADRPAGEPEMFGPYRLEQRIGRGGMGEVFRAFDTGRQRTVALKRLHGGLADDAEYQERFRRESRLAARLSSPHVVPIHDFGTIDGSLFIDMRLVSGVDLADEIERCGRLEPQRAASIVRQLADALDAAHEDGLVHRDVKPSNVLLSQHRGRDFVYLVDFGIVRTMGDGAGAGRTGAALTGTGLAIGTLSYMAPELFTGREVDRGVDVYALGCLLFEALTGRPPFVGDGPTLMYEHLNATPPRPSEVVAGLPPAVDDVIARALAKSPAARFAGAGDLADAAYSALAGPGPDAVTPAPSPPAPRPPAEPTQVPRPPSVRYDAPADPGPGHPAPRPTWNPGPVAPPPGAGLPPHPPIGPHRPPMAAPAPRRARTGLWVGLGVVAVLVVVLGLLAVVGLSGSQAPAPTPAPTPAPAPVSNQLAAVFPDITTLGTNCTPYQPTAGEYTTSTGVQASAIVRCNYGASVPGGYVYYTQWPTAAAARQWHDDQLAQGPSLDNIRNWGTQSSPNQGPLHTRAASDGSVYATAAYADRPYGFDIVTPTLDGSNAMFTNMHLLPASSVPA
jgi:serine/threonine-protein kinase